MLIEDMLRNKSDVFCNSYLIYFSILRVYVYYQIMLIIVLFRIICYNFNDTEEVLKGLGGYRRDYYELGAIP